MKKSNAIFIEHYPIRKHSSMKRVSVPYEDYYEAYACHNIDVGKEIWGVVCTS